MTLPCGYTNTFLFCLCLWLPRRQRPSLLVLYIHRCRGALGPFQPSCPRAFAAKVTAGKAAGWEPLARQGEAGARGPSAGQAVPGQGLASRSAAGARLSGARFPALWE